MQPAKVNYKIYQGSTFEHVLRWESQTKTYVPINIVEKSAPCVITTTPPHELPVGWRFRVSGVAGMKEINSVADNYYMANNTTVDTITVNSINSLQYADYVSGGVVEYNTPVNLANLTARMQIREDVDSTIVLHELTTENNGIVLDNTTKTITLKIPASITAGFQFTTAVYNLELVNSTNYVSTLAAGTIILRQEVTR